jgi:SAM-dependent methyltransferase
MRSFDLGACFRLALIPFRAFHYLMQPGQQRAALQCIHRSLLPGGHLVINLFDPQLQYCVPTAPPFRSERSVKDPKTNHTIIRRFLQRINDPLSQVFTERFRIEEVDEQGRTLETEEASWTFRWTTRQEMRYLFELTDFEVVAEYSDFFRSPPAYGAEQVWVVRKMV